MCSKFGKSGLFTLELPALIAEKTIFDLLGMLDSIGSGDIVALWATCLFFNDKYFISCRPPAHNNTH